MSLSQSAKFVSRNAENNDTFIKYWIKVYWNRKSKYRTDSDGNDVRVFVDTGTNLNTLSRRQFIAFLDENLHLEYIEGRFEVSG